MYVYRAFDTSDMTNKLKIIILFLSTPLTWYYIIFIQPCKIPCSMQCGPLTPLTYPGSCKTCFFCIPVFGGKSFLIFSIINLIVDLKLICIIGLSDLVNSLIFADGCPGWHSCLLSGFFSIFTGQLALKFYWVKMCFFWHPWHYKLHLNRSVMPKPVYFLTVQEAHKEYNSLTDLLWAKYEQLDSGEYGAVGTPPFNAEACELAYLLVHVCQHCQKLNLPPPKELYRPTFFKHWRCFSDLNSYK